MTNYDLNRTYNESLQQLQTTDKVHADTFNPRFQQLINNDAAHKDAIDNHTQQLASHATSLGDIATLTPWQTTVIDLNGKTIGNFSIPQFQVKLGTVTLA
ncbi:hypothetical protein HPT25_23415 [Bacillus sp. BRMEA1]|uniref:hypothetical protein n=1 Tax=Neobacillus endophyticus TaxID=2738405 RepID=UPI001564D1D5|nr:hypothetical protein [Neobacillus endophyticus]NRD80275.1 hypothetical protein [Neobacillus endophyticus]